MTKKDKRAEEQKLREDVRKAIIERAAESITCRNIACRRTRLKSAAGECLELYAKIAAECLNENDLSMAHRFDRRYRIAREIETGIRDWKTVKYLNEIYANATAAA